MARMSSFVNCELGDGTIWLIGPEEGRMWLGRLFTLPLRSELFVIFELPEIVTRTSSPVSVSRVNTQFLNSFFNLSKPDQQYNSANKFGLSICAVSNVVTLIDTYIVFAHNRRSQHQLLNHIFMRYVFKSVDIMKS